MTEPAQLQVSSGLLSLSQAAEILKVSVETLLEWNNNNILKPTITTNGEVGYKQEQIDKFLAIQRISETTSSPITTDVIQPNQTPKQTEVQKPHQSVDNVTSKLKTSQLSTRKNGRFKVFGIVSSFSFLAILLLVVLITYQSKLNSTSNKEVLSTSMETENIGADTQQNTTGVTLLKSSSANETAPLTNKNIVNNINDTNENAPDNKLAGDYLNTNNQSASDAAMVNNQIPLLPVLGLNTNGPTTNFASRPNVTDNNSSVFDEKGNIKEQATTPDTLATTLNANGLEISGTPFKQTIYPTLLTLGLLLVVFGFTAQPSFVTEKATANSSVPNHLQTVSQVQKVLEINQKPDGSVVLYFQGDEHKISKPELNSETDQFIQRLMGFAANDTKEINYNILKDDKLTLNAPLSKLVTRLGFVGLKRDLFFPRTSKNRVIFRRYLTHQDLISLGLTSDQITNELLN